MFPTCTTCGLHTHCNSPFTPGRGNISATKLIIINEAPGVTEDETKEMFSGDAGNLLFKILGVRKEEVYFTNLVKCCPYLDPITRTGGSRSPSKTEIESCKSVLARELKMFSEEVPVMTLGNGALTGLIGPNAGISKEVGVSRKVQIGAKTFNLIPNYHPNAIIHNSHLLPKFQQTIDKAFSGKKDEADVVKYQLLNYEQSIAKIAEVIDLYQNGKIPWVCFDIETTDLIPWCGDIIMYSLCHDLDETSYVIPAIINNTVLPEHLLEYEPTLREKLQGIDLQSLPENEANKIIATSTKDIKDMLIQKHQVPFIIDPGQKARINASIKMMLELVGIIGHNVKFDLRWCVVKLGVAINKLNVVADTQIMAHQVHGRSFGTSLALKELARAAFNITEDWEMEIQYYLKKYSRVVDRHYGNIPTGVLAPYAGLDTYYTKKLFHQLASLMLPQQVNITNEVTRATIPLVEAESKGAMVDMQMLDFLRNSYRNAIQEIYNTISELPKVKNYINKQLAIQIEENSKRRKPKPIEELKSQCFNLGSIPTLKEIFYSSEYYNFPKLDAYKTAKGEPQTGGDVIEALIKGKYADGEGLTFLQGLDDYKVFSKLLSTYIEGLPPLIFDSLYKPEYFLTGTTTGRLSSGFHTLPSKSDIKRIFISRWASQGGLFLAADQSQLELRIVASLAGEELLIDAFKRGVDAHTATAAAIYKVPIDDVTSAQRKIGKVTNFAVLFGKGAHTLAQDLLCSVEEAQAVLDGFFSGYPKLKKFIDNQHKFVMDNAFVTTPMGRIIPVPDALHNDRGHIGHAKRCSVNYPVQSSASDCVLIAGNNIYYEMKRDAMKSVFIGSVHDSIEYDVFPGEVFSLVKKVKHHSQEGIQEEYDWITCPLEMDISLGTSWGGAIEFKVKEMTNEKLVLKGEAIAKDFKLLKHVAEKAYNVELTIDERKEPKPFSKDIFFKDHEVWDCTLVLTKRQT